MIISGKPAFEAVQAMRAEIGRGHDRHRHGAGRRSAPHRPSPGLAARSPVRIILDAGARLPLDSNLVASAREVPLVVAAGPAAPDERKAALREAGVRIIEVNEGPAGIDLNQLLETLAAEGFTRVLVEGGAEVASSLVAGDLADEVVIFRAPSWSGRRACARSAAMRFRRSSAARATAKSRPQSSARTRCGAISGRDIMFTGIVSDVGRGHRRDRERNDVKPRHGDRSCDRDQRQGCPQAST